MIPCKDCKFWEAPDQDNLDRGWKLGDCSNEKFKRGYNIKAGEVDDDGVLVENDEGWAFATGPDFSCVHAVAR